VGGAGQNFAVSKHRGLMDQETYRHSSTLPFQSFKVVLQA